MTYDPERDEILEEVGRVADETRQATQAANDAAELRRARIQAHINEGMGPKKAIRATNREEAGDRRRQFITSVVTIVTTMGLLAAAAYILNAIGDRLGRRHPNPDNPFETPTEQPTKQPTKTRRQFLHLGK